MKEFIERLPNNPINEKVGIAFNWFMGGTTMYFANGHEITTQYGFKVAVLDDPDIKITEKEIDEIIKDYNETHVTPDEYRRINKRYKDLQNKIYEEDKAKRFAKAKLKHPIRYLILKLQKKI